MRADIRKHTLNLREGDWDFLESIYKPNGIPTAVAIRTLISNFVDKKKAEIRSLGAANPADLEIDIG